MPAKRAIVAGLGFVCLVGTFGQAQERPKRERPNLDAAFFQRLDTNQDGVITLDEIPEERREMAKRLIDRMDSDSDGKVTRAEFDAAAQRARDAVPEVRKREPSPERRPDAPRPESARPDEPRRVPPPGEMGRPPFGGPDLFRSLDADRDQKLSREELANAVQALMKHDRNGDGLLTPEEIAEGIRGPRPDGDRGQRPDGDRGPAGRPGLGAEAMIERADKNGDGKLSKDEAPEMLRERFERVDSNSDGFIDKEELAALGRMRPARPDQPGPGPGRPFDRPGAGPSDRPGAGASDRPGDDAAVAANRRRVAAFLREHDKDADGRVSASEFPADRSAEFKKLDSNGDSFLTPDEVARGLSDAGPQREQPKEEPKP